MLRYEEDNISFIESFCKAYIPTVKPLRPQASFHVWLDCRALGLSQTDLVKLFTEKALLFLNDGVMFGPGGEGFMRMNVGTPRRILREALERLRSAVDSLQIKDTTVTQ